jgi:hypothetical protein
MEGEAQKLLSNGIQNMCEFHAKTLTFDQKMRDLMRECKEGLTKKDGSDSGKKSLMGWIKAFPTSNEESGVVITRLKARAVDAGIKLCNLAIDFVFMMMSRQEELAAKIWKFRSALEWVIEDGNFNSMVIVKILTLLEMAEGEVSEIKRSKELKNKGKSEIDDGDQKEISNERIRVNEILDQFFEQILHQIFSQLLEAALRLESIISHRSLPADSEALMKEALSRLECDLKQCEEVLEWIREDITPLKAMFPLELEDPKTTTTTETRNLVASKVYELWRGLLYSAEEDQEEQSDQCRIRYARENDVEGDVQMGSAVQPSLNKGVELQESREADAEVKKEAKKPSKGCCC